METHLTLILMNFYEDAQKLVIVIVIVTAHLYSALGKC